MGRRGLSAMSILTRKGVRKALLFAFLLILIFNLIFILMWGTNQPPLPFSCANFTESYWSEFDFNVDSQDDVASTVSRLWGIDKGKLGIEEDRWGNPYAVYWLIVRFTAPIGLYTAWFPDGVLQKIDVEWVFLRPTLSQAVKCLGTPEYYIAFYGPDPHDVYALLDLLYPEKGIVIRYVSPFTSPARPEPIAEFHPYMRIRELVVVAPGTPEQMVPAVYSVGNVGGNQVHNACLSKPWPGSFEAMEITSTTEFFECWARGEESD